MSPDTDDERGEAAVGSTLPRVLRRPIFIVAAPRSGSTLLFETLSESGHFATLGGEAHWLVESVPTLRPGSTGVESNRLTSDHTSDAIARHIVEHILRRLVDRIGEPVALDDAHVFLEKTPKNALRVPFFDKIFPDARFIFLWRDPRPNIGSIIEAWRSGRFVTYARLPGFPGPWSLLLPPDYAASKNKSIEQIAAYQWDSVNRIVMDDLDRLSPDRWIAVNYEDFITDPPAAVQRLLDFADLELDSDLKSRVCDSLPYSRYTLSAPDTEKWRAEEAGIRKVLPSLQQTWDRLRALPR